MIKWTRARKSGRRAGARAKCGRPRAANICRGRAGRQVIAISPAKRRPAPGAPLWPWEARGPGAGRERARTPARHARAPPGHARAGPHARRAPIGRRRARQSKIANALSACRRAAIQSIRLDRARLALAAGLFALAPIWPDHYLLAVTYYLLATT